MMVVNTENTTAQSSVYPPVTPAKVQMVMVPGPIKAAVTRVLGPKYFERENFKKLILD